MLDRASPPVEESPEERDERVRREAEREALVPGIVFRWGVRDRVVYIRGTGIKVYIVARTFNQLEGDELALAKCYHWLTWEQLQSALDYYAAFKEEIDARIAEDGAFDIEAFWAEHPSTRPSWRA